MSDWQRFNTDKTFLVEQQVLGYHFQLAQNPNSQHLGTTVWDASIVLAKFFEQARGGEFAAKSVAGKHAVELGSGMGLAGMAMALLGCNVVLTDVADVLPLLRRNVSHNLNAAAVHAWEAEHARQVGSVEVKELDWSVDEQRASFTAVDYIIAADCVYHEHVIHDLLRTILHLSTPKTTVIIANELRSESVQAEFMRLFAPHFKVRRVPSKKLHSECQLDIIHVYTLKRHRAPSPPCCDAAAS